MIIPALLALVFAVVPASADDGSLGGAVTGVLQAARQHAASAGPGAGAGVGAAAAAPAAAPPPSGPAAWDVDLSGQLPDNGGNQGSIGDCHDFAAANLLEAVLDRRTGQHVSLSPADLFIQHTVLGPLFFKDFDTGGESSAEGGMENYDTAYGINHGVATDLDYDQFQQQYNDYVKSDVDPEIKALHLKKLPPSSASNYKAVAAENSAELDQAAKEMLEKTDGVMNRIYQQIDPRAATERLNMKSLLTGFHAASRTFKTSPSDYNGTWDNKNAGEQAAFNHCAQLGKAQAALIRAELDAGRPVAAGLDISGLPADGPTMTETDYGRFKTGPEPANHAIVIVGYVQPWPSYYVYKIRNWWGIQNIGFVRIGGALQRGALWDADTCRIHLLTTALTPSENSQLPIMASKAAH